MHSTIWAYPWDLLDEGPAVALGRIRDSGIQSVSVTAVYHSIRALSPHNPKQTVVHGEGGVCYFRPDLGDWPADAIRPALSQLIEANDPFTLIGEACTRAGVGLRAWVVLHHNTRLGTDHPDACVQNAFDDRYPFALCPSNPKVRGYSLGVVRSLAARPEIEAIELESLGFMGIDHSGHHAKAGIVLTPAYQALLSLCFCPHCAARYAASGLDVDEVRTLVRERLRRIFEGGDPVASGSLEEDLTELLGASTAQTLNSCRSESVSSLLAELTRIKGAAEKLEVMVSPSPWSTGAGTGADLSTVAPAPRAILTQAFHADPQRIAGQVQAAVQRANGLPVRAGLQTLHPFVTTAKGMSDAVSAARDARAEALAFYHYGLAPLTTLDWIRGAIA